MTHYQSYKYEDDTWGDTQQDCEAEDRMLNTMDSYRCQELLAQGRTVREAFVIIDTEHKNLRKQEVQKC